MRRSTLTLTSTAFLFGTTIVAIAASACGGSDPQPAASPSATYQYPPPQQTAQPYPPQTGYPQQPYPQQTAYPQPTPTQTAPAASGGQMATPGPLALPCSNDGACGLHRCNVPAGKCAFPCQTAVDCANGNQCMMGVCVIKPPGTP
ncbi:MAG: hypothetical protein U0270_24980 [Labilithrix sp.]